MWEFIHKILVLFLERKSKFKRAEERLTRREEFFDGIKKIDNLDIEEYQKHARRNGLAQTLVGSRLVSYRLVDFVSRNKNIVNFETVSKDLAFWDTSLNIERDNDRNIIGITLNEDEYKKEKRMMLLTLFFNICVFLYSLYTYKISLLWLENYLLIPDYIAKIFLLILSVLLMTTSFLLFISIMILFDLKRIVELLNR
ncbi:hypothetical protein C9426_01520 [Serratia sp. S1B]|nr:hypothetical protein C9426_01520 [Serratia sp. S1B]